jgi:hypothetical protein
MKLVMKLFDIMNDMKNIFIQQIEQYHQKNGYEEKTKSKKKWQSDRNRLVNDE